jgi:hypothetical protein
MGFQGDVLRAEFLVDKVWARSAESTTRTGGLTVPHTLERQEMTRWLKIFATGGGWHITTDDMWLAMERTRRDGLVEEKEKEKKSRLEANTRRDAAPYLSLDALKGSDLTTLLMWRGVKALNMENNVAKKKHSTNKWLRRAARASIQLAYGRTPTRRSSRSSRMQQSRWPIPRTAPERKRDAIRACRNMTAEEKEEVLRIFAETEAASADNNLQTSPH